MKTPAILSPFVGTVKACTIVVMVMWAVVAGLAPVALSQEASTNVLIPAGSIWRYLDDGSDAGVAWRESQFDDSEWPWGFAQLGFGDLDEETTLASGPSGSRIVTYYFRTVFDLAHSSTYTNFSLSVLRDDGVAVYVNGLQVWRNNLPSGAIGYRTLATANVTGADEDAFHTTNVAPSAFHEGSNLVAVEVHQSSRTSSDLSFDLELTGVSVPPQVMRGPYLQRGGPTNIVIRWRTNLPCDSQVRWGADPALLDSVWSDAVETNEHEVALTGLNPGTRYYYSIGTTWRVLAGDESYRFVTAPTQARPTRIWVQGDSGTANVNSRAVYESYLAFTGVRETDLWLMLGDNAYGIGADYEYQSAVFDLFPTLLRRTVLWSTIGNHETYSGSFEDFPYLHIFTLPKEGEAGGVPSGTERYYSFNYGNIHFVCLDAMTSLRSSDGPMATWLGQDLQANTNEWVIAFWHHPPYTKGSHDSDWEGELVEMRQNIVPILEAYGVDLVLSGHSHCYERSFLINGHYGPSTSLEESMKIDGGDGREDGTGPYVKPEGPGENQGAVYIVAGSSGQVSGGSLDHPAMITSMSRLGSLVLDIDGPRLHATFLRETGAIDDYFTIVKGPQAQALRLVGYHLNDGVFTLAWNSQAKKAYVVERATRLQPADWIAVSDALPGSGGLMSWMAPVSEQPAGAFFRVRTE